MSFQFKDSDGTEVQNIYSCQECIYLSTGHHFTKQEGERRCPLCRSPASKVGQTRSDDSMPAYQYQRILDTLKEETSGVGAKTISNIDSHFDDGDDLVSAAESAYRSGEWSGLTSVDGIGQATAEAIVSEIANIEEWEGGVTDGKFSLSQ